MHLLLMKMLTSENLRLIKIKEFGWESLKIFCFPMKDQIGVIKMANLNFQKIQFFFQSKVIGSGAQNG